MGEWELLAAVRMIQLKRAAEGAAYTVSREWDAKQREWRERQARNVARWIDQYNDNVDRLDKVDANLDKLAEMRANAKGAARQAQVDAWIEESEAKKKKFKGWNKDLRDKISDVNEKLSQGSEAPWFYRGRETYGMGVSIRINTGNGSRLRLTKREAATYTAQHAAVGQTKQPEVTTPNSILDLWKFMFK